MIYTCMKHFVYICILQQYICKIKNMNCGDKIVWKIERVEEKLIQYQENMVTEIWL